MEVKEGRGPLFLDCTKLPADNLHHLKATIGTDKDTLPDYFEQKGIDIAAEPFEVEVSKGCRPGRWKWWGQRQDRQPVQVTVEGLFAAGDCRQIKIRPPGADRRLRRWAGSGAVRQAEPG